MKTKLFLRGAALVSLLTFLCVTNSAQNPLPTFKLLYTFQQLGGNPVSIMEVSPGNFLGVTEVEPLVFSVNTSGNLKALYKFPVSTAPFPMVASLNGKIYGAAAGSPGANLEELFWIGAKGEVGTLQYNGATQGGPSDLVQSPDGHLYTFFGTVVGAPAVFSRLGNNGEPVPLYSFPASQGVPQGNALFLGHDGNFYGLASLNNGFNVGIFKLTPDGSFSWVVPSIPNGTSYIYDLIQASNGKFYGTLPQSGSAAAGAIYEASLDGTYKIIYQFPQPNTGIPETLLEASDGMIYITTRGFFEQNQGYSSVLRLNPSTGKVTTVYEFTSAVNGECECRFVQGSDGKLYGVTANAGTYQLGTVFSLNLGLPKPKPKISYLGPKSGSVGQTILLFGSNLFNTSAVSFNGIPATSFEVPSSQGIWVKVPEGATTGPIAVTTPAGSFTTTEDFTVQ
jgi:hypothetical protein